MRRREFIRSVAAAGALSSLGACGLPPSSGARPGGGSTRRLDSGWRFLRADSPDAMSPHFDDTGWEEVMLPHAARIESLVTGAPGSDAWQWQGICWYRLRLPVAAPGRKRFLKFEAAMNVADVWLDGDAIGRHDGGFLPFVIDISDRTGAGAEALLAVRLDNRDDPVTGPKPLHLLDFNLYHGLYRYVYLIDKDRLHITDPFLADRPASGGVFVTCGDATPEVGRLRVQIHVRNDHDGPQTFRVHSRLADGSGAVAAETVSEPTTLAPSAEADIVQALEVARPQLWSPRSPALYDLHTHLEREGVVVEREHTRVGIRRIEITRDGFSINGERMFLRGTNRHQEHPYVGYAVPAAGHYRDAQRIKDAGFDYIRLSHYPHAPAFMDACDELGLVVMNCIPGWQYFGADPGFAELQYRNCRDLVRRDRNHPCVVLWEVSLNETAMPAEFVARTHAIAHEEYPGDQCFTCGWVPGYDVFIRARQHGGCHGNAGEPCIVSEYGDWEYYAMTAGLAQHEWTSLTPADSNSRQLRWHGERALLQQAANFQEAHNDNRNTDAIGDGLWVMFDYNRGYAPDIESSGCMDIFRLPKYARHFFRSQRDPGERLGSAESGPMVFIASEWTERSPLDVRVFSNCEEVELRLNGRVLERRRPDRNRMSLRLAHPPFTFALPGFASGMLEAVGLIGGAPAAAHAVRTPGPIERLALALATDGHGVERTGQDLLFAHASLQDAHGTTVADGWQNVAFGAAGDAALIGTNPFSTDAGIASILVRTAPAARAAALYAVSLVRDGSVVRTLSASARVIDAAPSHEVRYTTDGEAPGPQSPRSTGSVTTDSPVRAAVIVAGVVVAELDERTPRFRIPGSTAPAQRDPFRPG